MLQRDLASLPVGFTSRPQRRKRRHWSLCVVSLELLEMGIEIEMWGG